MSIASDDETERGCPKCGPPEPDAGTTSTTGGGLSKMFHLQATTFSPVPCTQHRYSDLDWLIRAEAANHHVMVRAAAERSARRDASDVE